MLMSMSKALIAYIRVSTSQQGKSGLGIEAQREAITRFAQAERLSVVDKYIEIETGKGADALERRPMLREARRRRRRRKPRSWWRSLIA
jgi:DNA invertase Pin-like site-specific DNA recombinase